MPENRDALVSHYRQMHDDLMSAIDGLTEAELTERSLDGWSVADHLGHLAFWDELRASEVERISAGFDSLWKLSDAQDGDLNGLVYRFRQNLTGRQARWEVDHAYERLIAALEAAAPRALDASLYGEAGLTSGHVGEHANWIRRWREERR